MKIGKRTLTLALVICALGATGWLVGNSRAGTETPEYATVKTDGKIEVRDYPELMVATTTMKSGSDDGFMTLFRFITGANDAKQKIEMTSPVLIESGKSSRTMSFIVPKATASSGIPKPTGDSVTVNKIEASRFVSLRFSGRRSTSTETSALEKLRAWMTEEKLTAKGEPIFAYYDPPWTPVFMRRNEVMLRIEKPEAKK
jgi:hypothetical protein